ncbi:MAG: nuclear transport factor 2 family protein [Rhizobiales bacterium]|nr:nuclear transport factor 2 family protein [Hyphomicrobiales bacterium]
MSESKADHLEALLVRVAIESLIAEFAYLIDHDQTGKVADLFTQDGWYGREGGARSVGRDAIHKSYAGRAERGERTARHIFTNLRLTVRSADEAEGTCVLLLFAADGPPPHPAEPMLVQDYTDTYRKVDGRWLFVSRETRALFVSPLFERVLTLGKPESAKA